MGASYQPEPWQPYATDPIAKWYGSQVPQYGSFVSSGAADTGIPYSQWQWMSGNGLGASAGSSSTPAMVPTVNPSYTPASTSSGLMPQNGATWNQVYGQMQVPTPYLEKLNGRFGWNNRHSFGAATPFNTSLPQYYQPPQMYPQTSFPSLMR